MKERSEPVSECAHVHTRASWFCDVPGVPAGHQAITISKQKEEGVPGLRYRQLDRGEEDANCSLLRTSYFPLHFLVECRKEAPEETRVGLWLPLLPLSCGFFCPTSGICYLVGLLRGTIEVISTKTF